MRKLNLRTVYMSSLLLASPLLMTGCDTLQGLTGSNDRDDTSYHSSSSATVTTYDGAGNSNASNASANSSSSAATAPKPSGQAMTAKPAVPMSAPTVGQ